MSKSKTTNDRGACNIFSWLIDTPPTPTSAIEDLTTANTSTSAPSSAITGPTSPKNLSPKLVTETVLLASINSKKTRHKSKSPTGAVTHTTVAKASKDSDKENHNLTTNVDTSHTSGESQNTLQTHDTKPIGHKNTQEISTPPPLTEKKAIVKSPRIEKRRNQYRLNFANNRYNSDSALPNFASHSLRVAVDENHMRLSADVGLKLHEINTALQTQISSLDLQMSRISTQLCKVDEKLSPLSDIIGAEHLIDLNRTSILTNEHCRQYYHYFQTTASSCYIGAYSIASGKIQIKPSKVAMISGVIANAVEKIPIIGIAGSILNAIISTIDTANTINSMHNILKLANNPTEMDIIIEACARKMINSRFAEISELSTDKPNGLSNKFKKFCLGTQSISIAETHAADDILILFDLLSSAKITLPERKTADIKNYAENIADILIAEVKKHKDLESMEVIEIIPLTAPIPPITSARFNASSTSLPDSSTSYSSSEVSTDLPRNGSFVEKELARRATKTDVVSPTQASITLPTIHPDNFNPTETQAKCCCMIM